MIISCQLFITSLGGGGAFPGGSEVKETAFNAGDQGSIPGSRRSPGGSQGSPL